MSDEPEDKRLPLEGQDAISQACDELLASARRHVRIYSPHLDPKLLNRSSVSTALSQLVRVSPYTKIQVLYADGEHAIKNGHYLITCARRFPSYMSLRRVAEEHRDNENSWILVDNYALLWREDEAFFNQAFFNWRGLREGGKLQRDFDYWWQLSEAEPAFRQMHI